MTTQEEKDRRISLLERAISERGWSLQIKRAEFLGRLRGHQRAALGSGRLGPLASMLNLEARICGLDQADSGQGSGQVQVLLNVPGGVKSEED